MRPGMLLQRLDQAIMPRCCVFCGVRCTEDETHICVGCASDLLYRQPCVDNEAPFEAVIAPLVYAFPVDAAIKALKFRRQLFYAPAFGEFLVAAARQLPQSVDALLPVPLHWRRHVLRGFNQSDEICKPVRKATGIPVLRTMQRARATPSQSGLSAAERRKNLRAAFRLTATVAARHVVIVDDVITTGTTVRAVARVLFDAGVEKVSVLAVARA